MHGSSPKLLTFALALLASCGGSDPHDGRLLVAAAVSVHLPVEEVLAKWNEGTRSVQATGTYAATSTLSRQLASGAPFDLLVSADRAWMDHLVEQGLIDPRTVVAIARDQLVWVEPALAPPLPDTPLDGPPPGGRWATADPAHVPLGRYARAALEQCGWFTPIEGRLLTAPDANAALRLVERREVEWGVVYQSAARWSDAVRIRAAFPRTDSTTANYLAGLTPGADPEARELLAWLSGDAGTDAFISYLFAPPREAEDHGTTAMRESGR